jgi:hypothetical protein
VKNCCSSLRARKTLIRIIGTRKRKRSLETSPFSPLKRRRFSEAQQHQGQPPRLRKPILSQKTRSAIEYWLAAMPSTRNRPETYSAYPASPPADEAISSISGRSHTSKSSSLSKIGPERNDYRLHLGRRNVEVQTRYPPTAISTSAMAIWRKERSSPPMTDEAAARVRRSLRGCADKRESDLRLKVESDLLPPSLPPLVSSVTEAEWRHHAKLPMDPVWDGVTPELA